MRGYPFAAGIVAAVLVVGVTANAVAQGTIQNSNFGTGFGTFGPNTGAVGNFGATPGVGGFAPTGVNTFGNGGFATNTGGFVTPTTGGFGTQQFGNNGFATTGGFGSTTVRNQWIHHEHGICDAAVRIPRNHDGRWLRGTAIWATFLQYRFQ